MLLFCISFHSYGCQWLSDLATYIANWYSGIELYTLIVKILCLKPLSQQNRLSWLSFTYQNLLLYFSVAILASILASISPLISLSKLHPLLPHPSIPKFTTKYFHTLLLKTSNQKHMHFNQYHNNKPSVKQREQNSKVKGYPTAQQN